MKMTTEEAFVKVLQMHGIEHSYKQIPRLACTEANETHGVAIMS